VKTYGFTGIVAAFIIAAISVVVLFACNPAEDKGDGSTGGGIISPSKNKDILVRIGNTTIKFSEIAKDQRFKQLMADKIFSAILVDKGQKDRIEITDEALDKAIERIKKGFPDPAMFEETMGKYGYTPDTFRDEQRRFLVLEKILRDRLQLTDEDIRDYYDANKRTIDQQYASENGLTEEETLGLTYETVKETADQKCYQEKGNEVFPKVREELIREYLGSMQFVSIPALTLTDFGILEPEAPAGGTPGAETPGAETGTPGEATGEAGAGEGAAAPETPDASAGTEAGADAAGGDGSAAGGE
jgi:hypothetical protein